MSSKSKSSARLRWKLVSQVLISRQSHDLSEANVTSAGDNLMDSLGPNVSSRGDAKRQEISTRLFGDFHLFSWARDDGTDWYKCTCSASSETCQAAAPALVQDQHHHLNLFLFIRFPMKATIVDIQGFDNTGNICVWPSEQVLAFLCLQISNTLSGKNICELGGGMTCLAGNIIAVASRADNVLLTDGNTKSIENCAEIVRHNREHKRYAAHQVGTRHLRWDAMDECADCANIFDLVIAADCLFVEAYHQSLCDCVFELLRDQGTAMILAPRRRKTLDAFVEKAQSKFVVDIADHYNDIVWNLHQNYSATNPDYEMDLHYPLLLKMSKKASILM